MPGVEVPVGIKNAAFKRGLDEMSRQANDFKKKIASGNPLSGMGRSLGAALSLGGLAAGLQGILDKFSKIEEMSVKFGTSAVSVQKLGGAAKLDDVDLGALLKTMSRLTLTAQKMAASTKEGSDKFAKLGINAREFAAMEPDQKLLALSAAFERANANGGGAAAMLSLLGARGAQIIPLLARGPEALNEALAKTPALGDAAVRSLKHIADLQKQSEAQFAEWGIALAQKAQEIGVFIGMVYNSFTMGAKEASRLAQEQMDELQAANHDRETKPQTGAGAVDADDSREQMENQKELDRLNEAIADHERKNRLEALSDEDRLNAIYKERENLRAEENDETEEGLKAKRAGLELDLQAMRLQDEVQRKADAAEKHKQDLMAQHEQALDRAMEQEAEQDEKNALDSIKDPKEKAAALQAKQKQLMDDARELAESSQRALWNDSSAEGRDKANQLLTESAKKRTAAGALTGEINRLLEKGDDNSATADIPKRHLGKVFASQLAEVGLGGHAAAFGPVDKQLAEAKKQTKVLEQLLGAIGGRSEHRPSPAMPSELQHGPLRTGRLSTGHL